MQFQTEDGRRPGEDDGPRRQLGLDRGQSTVIGRAVMDGVADLVVFDLFPLPHFLGEFGGLLVER